MSHAYRDATQQAEPAAGENADPGFGGMLRLLADQVTTADREYSELLGHVLDCLNHIKAIPRRVPAAATRAEARAPQGWDEGAAEALARSYEEAARSVAGGGTQRSGDGPAGEDPFSAMACQIEQAFAPVRAEGSFLALSLRFDELERRVQSVLGGAPSMPDLETASEPGPASEGAKTEGARFDGIENLLAHVVERLSDERLAKVFDEARAVRLEQAGPETAAWRDAPPPPADVEAMTDRMEELCGVVDRMIDDHRRGNEAAMTMMATLQEAMVRVLDRLDAVHAAREAEQREDAVPGEANQPPRDAAARRLGGVSDSARSLWADWTGGAQRLATDIGQGWFGAAPDARRALARAADSRRRGALARSAAPTFVMIFLFGVLVAIEAANLYLRAPLDWAARMPAASDIVSRPAPRSGAGELPIPPRGRALSRAG